VSTPPENNKWRGKLGHYRDLGQAAVTTERAGQHGDRVVIDFGRLVEHLAITPESALAFAQLLIDAALSLQEGPP
jgi:hypothetical protein